MKPRLFSSVCVHLMMFACLVEGAWCDNWAQDNFDGSYYAGVAEGWIPYHSTGNGSQVTFSENTTDARSGSCQEIVLESFVGGENGIIRPIEGLTPNATYGVEIWMQFSDGLGGDIWWETDMDFRIAWDDLGRTNTPGSEGQHFDDYHGPGDFRWLGNPAVPQSSTDYWWHYFALVTTDSDGSGAVGLLWTQTNNEDMDGYRMRVDDMRIIPTYAATMASVSPTVDGSWSPGEYEGGAVYNIMFSGRADNLRYGHNGGQIDNEIMAPFDCSAVCTFVWDATALYVAAQVADATIRWDVCGLNDHNCNTWEDDAVEVIIDGDHSESAESRNDQEYGNGGGQVVVTAGNSTRDEEGWFDKGVNWWGVGTSTTSVSGQVGGGTFTCEFAVLWSKILESSDGTADIADIIGITIGIDDDDATTPPGTDNDGDGQLFQMGGSGTTWVSAGEPWLHEDQWGDLRLVMELTEIELGARPVSSGFPKGEWIEYR